MNKKIILNPFCKIEQKKEILYFNDYKKRKIIKIKNNDLIQKIIKELTKPLFIGDLYTNISKEMTIDVSQFNKIMNHLTELNILQYDTTIPLSPEMEVYARQIEFWESFFSVENGQELQEKITNKHLVIIGSGGLGSWISLYLTQMGFKYLSIVDFDKVEISNLSRQVLFNFKDIGENKVEVLKSRLSEINPKVNIQSYNSELREDCNILYKIAENNKIDMIVNCADEPSVVETSKWINHYCYKNNIPFLVGGGYSGHSSKIGTIIIPGKTPSWIDYIHSTSMQENFSDFQVIKEADAKYKGVINLTASLTAIIQTMDIIKFFSGLKMPLMHSRTSEFNIDNFEMEYTYFEKGLGDSIEKDI